MRARERIVVMAIAAFVVLGAAWMLVVSPARKEASSVGAEVATARGQLEVVRREASTVQGASQGYAAAYSLLASLGKAVPTSSEVPALMYAVDRASNSRKVQFTSITTGSSGSASGSSAAAPAASAGFTQMHFTFVFDGTYDALVHLLSQIEGFTAQTPTGALRISGRLLTVQSIALAAGGGGAEPTSSAMTWTITATAYVLAAGQQTGSGTAASSSAGATQQSASSSSGAGSSTAAAPAVVKATP